MKQRSVGEAFRASVAKVRSAEAAAVKQEAMAVSMKDVDSAFQGAGQKPGMEIWRIENFRPVPVPKANHGKFYTGDSYIILKTSALKSGAFQHDIHYWLGRETSQDEAGTAALKTVELDAALGGRAVQYREVQGQETERFLSYFRPCIIPLPGGVASGFHHAEVNEREHETRMYVCKGKHVVHVTEVPFARSSLNHDDIFILDTKSKIFQFNGSNSSIQERAKALEVVQYVKDTYHGGKCDLAAVEDGKLMADAEAGEFWGLFGGFAPLPRKAASEDEKPVSVTVKLFRIEKGQAVAIESDPLTKQLLDTYRCFVLDCGAELFVWFGRSTSLEERKRASSVAEEFLSGQGRPKVHITRVIEGCETLVFRSKFSSWPLSSDVNDSEDGRGKVAALLKRQGFNVKGLLKAAPLKDEPQPHIDCTGNLQVWRVNGSEKKLIPTAEQTKFYSEDCYIFQYTYPGDDNEEVLVGTWFGKKSLEEERATALSLANKMVESLKFLATQARIYEGSEPVQFFSVFQSFIVYKGGMSSGYKKFITENGVADDTYSTDGLALFRVQGSGPENMQAIQVEPVAASLNSSYCYILHSGSTVYTWAGSLTIAEDQGLVERQLDIIKPNIQSKPQKEGNESEKFWSLLGGKSEYRSQRSGKGTESDPHLFSCVFSKGNLKVKEIFNFNQDDLMTEDIFILDCQSNIFVWIGGKVDSKLKAQALTIGEKYLEHDFLMEKVSRESTIFVVMEGSEPPFFTRFFTWDSAKSSMHGNSFQRKLTIIKDGVPSVLDKPKRRAPIAHAGRTGVSTDNSQRSRSMSFSPDRVRVRGRSPAFNALASAFEKPDTRNLSMPPPVGKKLYPRSGTPDPARPVVKSSGIASISSSFEQAKNTAIPRIVKATSPDVNKPKLPTSAKENGESVIRNDTPTVKEDVKESEVEDEEGLPLFPYERLKVDSVDPVPDIDVTKRETYLSSKEFKEKFGMAKGAFLKLPKWKQNKMKINLKLF